MKNEQGFSLIELLIVVAIIAIIAAIAVPSLLTARMAANEGSAIQGCRTVGSAEIAYAAANNQQYDLIATLITNKFLDPRFDAATYTNGLDGYTYAEGDVQTDYGTTFSATTAGALDFAINATPVLNNGRFVYGIGTDQVVRYISAQGNYTLPSGAQAGSPLGAAK